MLAKTKVDSPESVQDLKMAYLKTVTAPLDGMWESGLIPMANHWQIESDGQPIGYFCVNDEGCLLQFYVKEELWPQVLDFLKGLIDTGLVKTAVVGTNEPATLSLCLDLHTAVSVDSYLFHDSQQVNLSLAKYNNPALRLVMADELSTIVQFDAKNTDGDVDWLQNFLRNLIAKKELFVLEHEGVILGVGECRASVNQPPYADLGMIVSTAHRSQGIGSYILSQLKSICQQRQLNPICSTTVANTPSRKAIEKAGFIRQHRLLKIDFG